MKNSYPVGRFAILALVAILFAAPTHAFADTFQISDLGGDNGKSFRGFSSTGLAFFESVGPCSSCYLTYYGGVLISASSIAPTFTPDNGTLCTPSVPAGGRVARGICNNGLDAFTGTLTSSQNLINAGIYFGPTFERIFGGSGGSPFPPYPFLQAMNSLGDMFIDDQANDELYLAIDLTTAATPEPSSFLLLLTGTLALAALARRRFIAQS